MARNEQAKSLGEILTEITKTIGARTATYSPSEQEDLSQYDCKICKDQGLIHYRYHKNAIMDQYGTPDADHTIPEADFFGGKVDPSEAYLWTGKWSKRCSCVERKKKQKEIDKLLTTSNMSPKFKKRTFDTIIWLDPNDYRKEHQEHVALLMKGQRKAYDIVWDYCQNWEEHRANGEGFGLTGDVGTAKTHLLAAKTNYLVSKGVQSVFVNTLDIFDEIRSCFEVDEKGKPVKEVRQSDIINLLKTCEDLSLDDVGTEKVTDWVFEKYYNILNYRYEYELPTSFTTNETLAELKEHLGKSYRRLVEPAMGRLVDIKGPSFEQLKRLKVR
jgi:DNA replication protein DnaC